MSARRLFLFRVAVFVLVFAATPGDRCAPAGEFRHGFDDEQTSWIVHYNKSLVQMLSHRRHTSIKMSGGAAENLEFDTREREQIIQLEHQLPRARVFDELKLSLWVRSNRPGAVLFLRVVFPHQLDPSNDKVLSGFIRGETYTDTGNWQRLNCTTLQRQIDDQIRQARDRLKDPNINTREMLVDRVFLMTQLDPGTTEFFLDDLRFGPVVEGRTTAPVLRASDEADDDGPDVEFRLDGLLVEGIPFFPRIVPYHGERPETLRRTRANVVWVPNYQNQPLMAALRAQDLWITATPPRAISSSGEILNSQTANILPFTSQTSPILFWNLGSRIPPQAKDDLVDWKRQILNADSRHRRPILADVTGEERIYSRHVGLLGVSRHTVHTTFPPKRYRDWLIQKRKLALPGTFMWTWIQVEPSPVHTARRLAAGQSPLVVEPEQIRLQVYSALAAGCRGIGYWLSESIDEDDPAVLERRLAITQLNLELELIEPLLATGSLLEQVPFRVEKRTMRIDRRMLDFRVWRREQEALLKARDNQIRSTVGMQGKLEAAIIQSDYGILLLPVWYQTDAQYVPSQMAANNATIIVRSVDESASAWEVSTTGVRSLTRERVTGGLKITLPKFDQTAAVILTSDQTLIAKLRRKMQSMREQSARVSIDLMQAKLKRVRQVDAELQSLNVGQLDAPQLLSRATALLESAENAFGRRDFQSARQLSADAGQLMRILQSAYWYDAVRSLASPVSSPHTICFQTLPDHWRLVSQLGRSRLKNDANLLQTGGFEDIEAMVADGWKHTQNKLEGVRAMAELYPASREGNYSLRLVAVPEIGREPPVIIQRSPVTVVTPPLPVIQGQIVHVGGWVRVVAAVTGSLDGAMLYDNQLGPPGALRWHKASNWRRFEIIRTIQDNGDFKLTMELTGLGEVQFDDVRVVPHSPRLQMAKAPERPASQTPSLRSRAWELFERLPKLNNPIPKIPNSIPRLSNPIPRLNGTLPSWNPLADEKQSDPPNRAEPSAPR